MCHGQALGSGSRSHEPHRTSGKFTGADFCNSNTQVGSSVSVFVELSLGCKPKGLF